MVSTLTRGTALCAVFIALSPAAIAEEHRVPSLLTPDLETAVAVSRPGDVIAVVADLPAAPLLSIDHDLTLRGTLAPVQLSGLSVAAGAHLVVVNADVSAPRGATCPGLCVNGGSVTGTDLRLHNSGVDVADGVLLLDDADFLGPHARLTATDSVVSLTRSVHRDVLGTAVLGIDSSVVVYDVTMRDVMGASIDMTRGLLELWGGDFSGAVGPAIAVDDTAATLVNTVFVGHRAVDGAAIWAHSDVGATLVVDGLVATNLEASGWGGVLYADGATSALARWDVTDATAASGGALAVQGGSVHLTNSSLAAVSATGPGGGVYARYADVSLTDTAMVGGAAPSASDGGLVFAQGGALQLSGVDTVDLSVTGSGGVVAGSGELTVLGLSATGSTADRGGVVAWSDGTAVVEGLVATRSRAREAAVMALSGIDHPTVSDGTWIDARAVARGGGMWVDGSDGGEVSRMRLCDLHSDGSGAAVLFTRPTAGTLSLVNNIFIDNHARVGGTIGVSGGGAAAIHNNTVLADGSPAVLATDAASADLVNNLVVSATLPVQASLDSVTTGGYNVWPANSGAWPEDTTADRAVDPQLAPYRGSLCHHPVWLAPDSTLRDSGSPDLVDPDGTRSDVGAHGGPNARLADADGDGHSADVDCDDSDARVHPGASDAPYDGIDQDCDGYDACDADGDGSRAVECGGPDCDDGDPSVGPGQSDSPYDGIDQDCDGTDLVDADGDGWVAVRSGGLDCDDGDPTVHPGAADPAGDDVDQDCDGLLRDPFLAGGATCSTGGDVLGFWPLIGLILARRRRE